MERKETKKEMARLRERNTWTQERRGYEDIVVKKI